MNHHYRAFGSLFFLLHQGKLLWLLNAPVVGRWFRRVLRISGESSSVGRRRIFRILPHAIFWWDGPRQKAEFRTHAKFSKRLYYAFRPLWWTLHAWDWCVADRWVPQLSFGFSTLTAYPNADADAGKTSCDGFTERTNAAGESWATLIAGAGTAFDVVETAGSYLKIISDTTTNEWRTLRRTFLGFDTSGLTASASISAAVLSIMGYTKQDAPGIAPNLDIYAATPASNTALASTDHVNVGNVSQTGLPVTYANWPTSDAWVDFTFNATGRGNVSKTGVSLFCTRNANYEVSGTPPAWSSVYDVRLSGYRADNAGTANDPKLVVTYTLPIIPVAMHHYNMMRG